MPVQESRLSHLGCEGGRTAGTRAAPQVSGRGGKSAPERAGAVGLSDR